MKKASIISLIAATAMAAGTLIPVAPAAAGMFDMMSPGKWFGDDDDDYYRYRRWGGPYGYGGGGPYGYGPYGYGGGPYGSGYGPYGYGGGPYGGGYGPYGYPGAYGPGGNTIVVTPQGSDSKASPRVPE